MHLLGAYANVCASLYVHEFALIDRDRREVMSLPTSVTPTSLSFLILWSENRRSDYMKMKICSKCGRELPKNTDYYFKKKDTKDGFTNRCKECQGYGFTNKLTKIPKEGHKFCIKCDRELPVDARYFPIDKACKDGIRNVCRECGKDGHFMEDNYTPKRVWTKEENKLFVKIYPHYTTSELIEYFYPSETKKTIEDRACRLACTNTKTKLALNRSRELQREKVSGENNPNYGKPMSLESRIKLSKSLKEYYKYNPGSRLGSEVSAETREKLSKWRKERKIWAGKNNPRHKNPLFGSRNGRWEGGKTPLYFELRSETRQWQLESMKHCDYKCVVTNGEFDHIHHLYPFRKIIDEVFENLNLDQRRKVADYTEEDFNRIKDEMHRLHKEYGFGVCLRKDIHKLFHDLYGYTNNTPEQFEEFKARYRLGEFNEALSQNTKQIV